MAVTRIKAYHSEHAIACGISYIQNPEKTDPARASGPDFGMETYHGPEGEHLTNAFLYAANPDKTRFDADGRPELLISGHNCMPDNAELDFKRARDLYYQNGNRETVATAKATRPMRAKLDEDGHPVCDPEGNLIYDEKAPIYHDPKTGKVVFQTYEKQKEVRSAYMWVLSFPGKKELGYELDPRLVHEIGREFCRTFLPEYPCTIASHVNTDHYHDHIMQCAYSVDGTHKYRDNMSSLTRAREIADELSLLFGLPIILNPGKEPGISHYEWERKKDGTSWKEQLRLDIRQTASMAKSPAEFKELLTDIGYRIRETEHHYTYIMPGTEEDGGGRRCRDSRLNGAGDRFDYTKDAIGKVICERASSLQQEQHPTERLAYDPGRQRGELHLRSPRITISRYSMTGRRRSTLEIILIEALKIIGLLMDLFQLRNPPSDHPVYRPAKWKLAQMEDALAMVQRLGIRDKQELAEITDRAGALLSHLKKEHREQSAVADKDEEVLHTIDEAARLLRAAEAVGFALSSFELPVYTKEEIRTARAALTPMSPAQRRDLYLLLSETPYYRLKCKYDALTYEEGKEIIAFLRKKSGEVPERLIDLRNPPEESSLPPEKPETDRTRADKELFFRERLTEYPLNTQLQLDQCRELLTELASLGITPDHLQEARAELMAELALWEEIAGKLAEAKTAYRDLKRLAYAISLAENEQFTHGPLYQSGRDPAIERTQTDTPEHLSADVRTEKSASQAPAWNTPDSYFDQLTQDL